MTFLQIFLITWALWLGYCHLASLFITKWSDEDHGIRRRFVRHIIRRRAHSQWPGDESRLVIHDEHGAPVCFMGGYEMPCRPISEDLIL
jgi:hypothetical protein